MFSKDSRYRAVPDVSVSRQDGRLVTSKDVRPLPETTGTLSHTIGDGDRLDQLAFTYYRQPLQYWRICDANPGFPSPLALLGQESLVTGHYTVTRPDHDFSWAKAIDALSATIGVEDVVVRHDITLEAGNEKVQGHDVSVVVERSVPIVTVTFNRAVVGAAAVTAALENAGLHIESRSESGRAGQQIVIPVAARGQAGS